MMLLEDWFDLWARGNLGRYVVPHWQITRRRLIRGILAQFANCPLGDLRAHHLLGIQNNCQLDGLAASTTNTIIFGALAAMFRDAEVAGHLDHAVRSAAYRGITRLKEDAPPARRPFSREERDAIVGRFYVSTPYGEYVEFLFATGMRMGEALALTWRDVDVGRRWCHIRRARYHRTFTPCKTKHSQREIALTTRAAGALARLSGINGNPVFLGPRGAPLNQHNITSRYWGPILLELNIWHRPMYCARHSFISWQLESGKKIADVARYVGSSVEVIEARYWRYTMTTEDGDRWDEGL